MVEPHYSASQIQLFRRCPRAWFTKYVTGIRQPSTAAQERGSMVHGYLERYLRSGDPPPASAHGKIAHSGLHLLPEPGSGEVEVEFWLRDGPALPVLGYIDYVQTHDDPPWVLDHKTTSALRWMKTSVELADDLQMTVYGQWALGVTDADELHFTHVYYGTRYEQAIGSRYWARRVDATVSATRVRNNWSDIVKTTCEMRRASALIEADVSQNFDACSDYGGCPYLSRCFSKGGNRVSLNIDALFDDMVKPAKKATPKNEVSTSPERFTTLAPSRELALELETVNGPEAPPNLENLERAAQTAPAPAPEQPPGRRKRRVRHPETGELITREERDALLRSGAVDPATDEEREIAQPSPGVSRASPSRRIYVNCVPVKSLKGFRVLDLADIVAPYVQEVLAQHKVSDLGLIEYARGYDLVAGKLRAAGWPANVDAVLVDKDARGTERWLAVLVPLAEEIVRSY